MGEVFRQSSNTVISRIYIFAKYLFVGLGGRFSGAEMNEKGEVLDICSASVGSRQFNPSFMTYNLFMCYHEYFHNHLINKNL